MIPEMTMGNGVPKYKSFWGNNDSILKLVPMAGLRVCDKC